MARVWSSGEVQELAAGYTIQNLDADELAQFQALRQSHPEMEDAIEELLRMVGYLVEQAFVMNPSHYAPPLHLKKKIVRPQV